MAFILYLRWQGMRNMGVSPGERVKNVRCNRDSLRVDLLDGRTIIVPLTWYPRLLHATPQQRANWRIAGGGYGIHWPDVDEDLSAEGLLRGLPAPRVGVPAMAGARQPEVPPKSQIGVHQPGAHSAAGARTFSAWTLRRTCPPVVLIRGHSEFEGKTRNLPRIESDREQRMET